MKHVWKMDGNMYSMKIYANAIILVFPLIQQNSLKLGNLTWFAYVRGWTLPDESTMEVTHQKSERDDEVKNQTYDASWGDISPFGVSSQTWFKIFKSLPFRSSGQPAVPVCWWAISLLSFTPSWSMRENNSSSLSQAGQQIEAQVVPKGCCLRLLMPFWSSPSLVTLQ